MRIKTQGVIGFVFIVLFALTVASIAHAVGVASTITVGGAPWGVAYDSGRGEIFMVNSGTNSVSVISDSTNAVLTKVTAGQAPYRVVYDSGKSEVFVANYGANSVSVISDSSNTVVATVPVGASPASFAYDSGKGEVFVANSGTDTVSVISDGTNTVVGTVTVGTNPYDLAYDSGKGEVFVANSFSRSVSVISDSTNSVVATVNVESGPLGVAYDSGKGELFVANSVNGTVSVISDISNSVVATIAVGTTPGPVDYAASKGEIFVANRDSGSVNVISDSTNAVTATVNVGSKPYGIAYDSGKDELYVANYGSGTISVMSDSSGTSPTPSTSVSTSPSTSVSPTPATSSSATSASSSPTSSAFPSSTTSSSPSPTVKPTVTPAPTPEPSSAAALLQQVWVPKPVNAVEAVGVAAIAMGALSLVFAAVSNPLGSAGGKLGEKTKGLIPDNIKGWLEEVVSSSHKVEIEGKSGSPIKPTRPETLAYFTATIVLAISFAYVKVITLNQIWEMLPVFFATSILVAFVQKYVSIAYLRSRGVWSEHKIWPFGLVLFLFTTFAFKVPFSSPTRSVHQSTELTERLGAIASSFELLIGLAFAGLFFIILKGGYPAIGGAGLDMCVIGSFVGTFPVSPMSGKDIFDHNKPLWAALFATTLIIFVAWLLLM